MKKVLSLILLVFWMGLIFSLSNKNGEASGDMSSKLIKNVVVIFTNIEEDSKEMQDIVNKYSFLVRKSAHFFEYFVLAILTVNMFSSFGIRRNICFYASIFCIIYAITDEVHQLFIDSRSGQISDVILDSSASIIGSFLFSKLYVLRGKYEKKNY